MRDKDIKVRCIKKMYSKCNEVVRTYDKVQTAYAEILENDSSIKEFKCNVPIVEQDGKTFTSDFVATDINGELLIRECVFKKQLLLPRTCKLLDISRTYWLNHGISDWAIVVEQENE